MNILLLSPQSDWHTVHSLVCIMTAYLTQLVRGCHRSANDPEKNPLMPQEFQKVYLERRKI